VPRTRLVSRSLSVLGAVAISYVLGAAAIFFGLPTSDVLERAFIGSRAWSARKTTLLSEGAAVPPGLRWAASRTPNIDEPSKTFDGFTLYACADHEGQGSGAFLIDMRGQPVHHWDTPNWEARLYEPDVAGGSKKVHNFKPSFYGLHLDSSGDLLAVSHGAPPVGGCRLAKLDKNSNLLWESSAPIHHDIDVADDGTIYAVQAELLETMPAGLEHLDPPHRSDQLLVLSSEGNLLKPPISIVEAIRNSPYAMLLSAVGRLSEVERDQLLSLTPAAMRDASAAPIIQYGSPTDGLQAGFDLLHANYVEVLKPKLADKFPAFKAGQVMISMRRIDTIAVLDVDACSVVWAASGPWRQQHDPHFLDNGHLLIFDNHGGPNGSRVIEYDPQTQAFPWWYPDGKGQPFKTPDRGMAQRLPNGNTLVVDSQGGQIMEVSPSGQLVWSYTTGRFITTARRYGPDELHFLGGQHARP
jgi:hypothetical protein